MTWYFCYGTFVHAIVFFACPSLRRKRCSKEKFYIAAVGLFCLVAQCLGISRQLPLNHSILTNFVLPARWFTCGRSTTTRRFHYAPGFLYYVAKESSSALLGYSLPWHLVHWAASSFCSLLFVFLWWLEPLVCRRLKSSLFTFPFPSLSVINCPANSLENNISRSRPVAFFFQLVDSTYSNYRLSYVFSRRYVLAIVSTCNEPCSVSADMLTDSAFTPIFEQLLR